MKALYFDNDIKKIIALKAASRVNRWAALGPLSPLRYAEVPEPQVPNARWLKVKNQACGLCGTDLHFMFMEMDPQCFVAAVPGISRKFLGHELVGVVDEVGDEVDGVAPGDRVAMRIDWPSCRQLEIEPMCRQCRAGNYMLCENLGQAQLPLRDTGGGFSPAMVMHRSQPFKIPDRLGDERALLLEPTASVVHAVRKAVPAKGDKVLVFGAGTIGLLCVAVAREHAPDAHITCVARYDFQQEAARALGADEVIRPRDDLFETSRRVTGAALHKGLLNNRILLGGFDVVYDSIGNDQSLSTVLRLVRGGGRLVLLGINFQPGKIDYTPIWNQEINVVGINCHATEAKGKTSFDVAADLLAKTDLPVQRLITHRFPMARYKDAVKTFFDKKNAKAIKIVLEHT